MDTWTEVNADTQRYTWRLSDQIKTGYSYNNVVYHIASKEDIEKLQQQLDVLRAELSEAMNEIKNMKQPFQCNSLL